ncbi:MAG: tetratricopeptide repeat protein [Capsulimonadaceae bacterium]|nr:tetratricopeptide repeat protein [Capsulimonadaceae bacterium]
MSVTDHDFVRWDDPQNIYNNPQITSLSWDGIRQAWNPSSGAMVYQPIDYMVLASTASLAKLDVPNRTICESGALLDPRTFHELSLMLHVINCLLVYALMLILFPQRKFGCLLGSLLFGLHPLQVESVAWASSVDRCINGTLSIVSLLTYVSAVKEERVYSRRLLYAAAVLAGVAAYLAKPVAITLPIAALLLDRYVLGRDWKNTLTWYIPWQLALLPLLVLTTQSTNMDAGISTPLWTRPFIAGDALTWHLEKLIAPFNLAFDYGRTPHYLLKHWWGYATSIVPASLLLGAYLLRRNRCVLAAAGLWLAALLPDIGLVPFPFQRYSTVADRYDYLALLGPCLAATALFPMLRWRYSQVTGSAIIVICAGLSAVQLATWQDTPSLIAQELSVNPDSIIGHVNMGVYYADHGQISKAIPLYLDAIRLDSTNYYALSNLGCIYMDMGRKIEAEKYLRLATARQANYLEPYFRLGMLFYSEGRLNDCIAEYRRILEINPHALIAGTNLAVALGRAGRRDEAVMEVNKVLKANPKSAQSQRVLQALSDGAYKQWK